MFKKIKQYFSLQRRIQIEILETLCSICLYFAHDRSRSNPYVQYFPSHFETLKSLSRELRDKENKNEH